MQKREKEGKKRKQVIEKSEREREKKEEGQKKKLSTDSNLGPLALRDISSYNSDRPLF